MTIYKKDNIMKANYLAGPQGFSLYDFTSSQKKQFRVISASIHLTYRFSSIITGNPNTKINSETLLSINSYIEKTNKYDQLPIFIAPFDYIPLEVSNGCGDIHRLPFMFYIFELESDGTDDYHAFSSLIYVSLTDNISLANSFEYFAEELESLDWEKNAKNWSP